MPVPNPNATRLWRPYTQMKIAAPPLEAVRTHGSRIVLADGRELIDGIASWWTAVHGYNHPHIVAAVSDQLSAMPHVMFGGLTHAPAERLARRLADRLPGDLNHVFFTDSGSVAVEVALKMAAQLWLNRGEAGRTRILAFRGGYHGDTLGAMSVCDPEEGMHRHFGAYLPTQIFCDLPRTRAHISALDAALARHRTELAAVIVEPLVQGAGGMRMHPPEVLATIARLARRHGLPLILDEIFTGFGRTGTLFACERAAVVPDILCLSKALTGGTMALAATIATKSVFEGFWSDDPGAALMHGPTFMANPLACAAANASLDLFEREPRLEQASAVGLRLAEGLEELRGRPGIADIRTLGAIGVVQFSNPPDLADLKARLVARGVWVRPFGDIVYLTPALTIERADLDHLIEAVVAIVGAGLRPEPAPAPPDPVCGTEAEPDPPGGRVRQSGHLQGRWRIVETSLWDRDHLDLMGPATIVLDGAGGGEMAFGALEASLDCWWSTEGEDFSWNGSDEGDQVRGTGSAERLPDGSLVGEIAYDDDEPATFRAIPFDPPEGPRNPRPKRRRVRAALQPERACAVGHRRKGCGWGASRRRLRIETLEMHIVTSEQTSPQEDRPVILLVEDEALTIMDLGDVLEDGGYETVQCASAERALSILQARPDICGLVTDVELSGKANGFELASSVAEARPKLPILIVSGRAAPDPDRMPAGAHFIARPCSGEDILDQLRRLMPC